MRGTALNGQVDILDCKKHLSFYKALVHSESIKVEIEIFLRRLLLEASQANKIFMSERYGNEWWVDGGQNLINSKSSSSSSTHLLVATFLAAVHR